MNEGAEDDGDNVTVATVVPDGNNYREMPAAGQQIHVHCRVLDGNFMNMGDAVNVDDENPPPPVSMRIMNKYLGSWGMIVFVSGIRLVENTRVQS